MATDLETATNPDEVATPRPSLKITGLHIRGLKSIASLDLPGDGLGWDGPIPDFVMVGGINGSGKTTLLEFLAGAFALFGHEMKMSEFHELAAPIRAKEARIDFQFSLPAVPEDSMPEFRQTPMRLLIGDTKFLNENADRAWFGIEYNDIWDDSDMHDLRGQDDAVYDVKSIFRSSPESLRSLGWPTLVYFPSERRTLISPPSNQKFATRLRDEFQIVDRWEPPGRWDDSLEARIYSVRWADLNAKEGGRPEKAVQFQAYQLAFERFFEGRKRLKWTLRGDLIVEIKSGGFHDLSELSSGEKQVILFMGELLHRWRPGSLILIDEPELHLHESYQTRLWESLVHWQKVRGGQVILSTQSSHLFRIADSAMKVLLSRQSR